MSQKSAWLWGMVIVAIAVAGIGFLLVNSSRQIAPSAQNDSAPPASNLSPEPNPQRLSRSGTTNLTFQQAYEEYYDHRIRINNCMAALPQITLKNGSKIMLDNRSADPLEITLGGKSYRLYDYDFAVITVSSSALPITIKMDCQMGDEVGKNIAQILVER